tara:strand:+ start:1313 stop:1468 length:156 start_codon:yes stop_codon:yes gene_type:complete
MTDKKPTMAELLKKKQKKVQESYYQKHQSADAGNLTAGRKEIRIDRTGGNK